MLRTQLVTAVSEAQPRDRRVINPWTWQDQYGFVQANEISGVEKTFVCSGQTAIDADGHPAHAGDIAAQASIALDSLETILNNADNSLADVVRLTVYTTDVEGLIAEYGMPAGRLAEANCRAPQTRLGVDRLAFPELLIEIEATAVL